MNDTANTKITSVTLTNSNNQTLVPSEIRKAWGFEGALQLEWHFDPETKAVSVTAIPLSPQEWVKATAGAMSKFKRDSEFDLDKIRNQWDN